MFRFFLPSLGHPQLRFRFFHGCMVFVLLLVGHCAAAQTEMSPEALRAEALTAFEEENWQLAHRRLAELLSLDGTNKQLQVKYAATLLHDSRLREEGIQRLASLAHEGELDGEGLYWWGRALMLQGEGADASSTFRRALGMAEKKASWRGRCELALRQSQSLPVRFDLRQGLVKLDAIDVPLASFHRYIHWERDGVRVMLVPKELQTKLDLKNEVVAPVTFWRGNREVFYHSLGSKGSTGMDLWVGTLDGDGEFSGSQRLPDWVNSSEDDVNPVWDQATQCLYFASNRPGTVGGMDVWRTCRVNETWERSESLGPLYNSVHDEWAFYPPDTASSGWLLTGRAAAYGGTEVWEVVPDGPPSSPVLLTTKWEVGGDVVPGTLTLSDAQSGAVLAELDLEVPSGTWDLVVASGQVVRYSFVTRAGEIVEGTYALPQVQSPSSVGQRMVMTMLDGKPFLDARPLTRSSTRNPDLTWGWNLVTNEVQAPEVKPIDIASETDKEKETAVLNELRPFKQFQSYPWWTEVQREERELAANALAAYAPGTEQHEEINPLEFSTVQEYEARLELRGTEVVSKAVDAVLTLAAADILRNEVPWEEAMNKALNRASDLWPVGSLSVEEVARMAKRRWAELGALYDQGVLPEVRDKNSLVGDGEWVELPWKRGDVATLAQTKHNVVALRPEAIHVVWALAHQPDASEDWGEKWRAPGMWDLDAVAKEIQDWGGLSFQTPSTPAVASPAKEDREVAMRNTLEEIRIRMSMLDSLEPTGSWTEDMRANELRQWAAQALMLSEALRLGDEQVAHEGGQTEGALRGEWVQVWQDWKESVLRGEASTAQANGEEDVAGWMRDLAAWMPADDENGWKPQDLVGRAILHWAMLQENEGGRDFEEEELASPRRPSDVNFEDAKRMLSEQLKLSASLGMEATEARQLVLSSWLLAKWRFDPTWASRSPDEMLAITAAWHPLAKEGLKAMSVQWAKKQQEQAPEPPLEGVEAESKPSGAEARHDEQAEGDMNPGEESVVPSNENVTRGPELKTGERGMHLGWFRRAPRLGALPPGTRLASQEGVQGLVRWVLVLPADEEASDWSAIQSWLGQSGVTDAHEVFWHGDEWKKAPVAQFMTISEGSEEVSPGDSVSLVTSEKGAQPFEGAGDVQRPASRDEGSLSETPVRDDPEPNDAGSMKGTTTPVHSDVGGREEKESQRAQPDETWGGDEFWEHGAPVELGNLMGTWYAVQVGAFRGVPQKDWIEQAGERLVYEPFPDGLARWYAGVRQDYTSAKARWEELKRFAPFADAFVVRLRNGEREVIRPGESAQEMGYSDLAEDSSMENLAEPAEEHAADVEEPTESEGPRGGVQGRAMEVNALGEFPAPEPTRPGEVVPSAEVGATLARAPTNVAATWHIDISRYYGTVPSKDVASLLFKAADWGVRSVELFGQTTYTSRSFSDLAEAERVLAEVRREGFASASLVKEK